MWNTVMRVMNADKVNYLLYNAIFGQMPLEQKLKLD